MALGTVILGAQWWRRRLREAEKAIETTPETGRLVVATRVHEQNAARPFDVAKLEAFYHAVAKDPTVDGVAVAVGCGGDHGNRLLERVKDLAAQISTPGLPLHIIPVQPWGKFVPGLNALVQEALSQGFDHILFQSVEMSVPPASLAALRSHFTANDIVVGAALPGHEFFPGRRPVDGRSCPWNTLALWHVKTLALTGFLGVAEGTCLPSREDAGVEEVTCLSLLQHLPTASRRTGAKLVRVPGIAWETVFQDPERQAWHERKMKSKVAALKPSSELLVWIAGESPISYMPDDLNWWCLSLPPATTTTTTTTTT
eukprot:CAMPEP_0118980128 /NCGR_PEP_ID=MMETSP1173-20130426/27590_1 /TAXON_ID=1034831 /ORGANISM="Rhizochromulina marina cf, Strain CCMP1243" /LENGTH=313 /DNA_ID=CAMNT_0006930449 /DNA_START=11 /DNA_END=950 /DNA_ORIENTATION=+